MRPEWLINMHKKIRKKQNKGSDTEAEKVEREWLCKYNQMFRALLLIWYGYKSDRENRSVALDDRQTCILHNK